MKACFVCVREKGNAVYALQPQITHYLLVRLPVAGFCHRVRIGALLGRTETGHVPRKFDVHNIA